MDRTLPNKCTKFGAKIFSGYWVITFLVLRQFSKPHPVDVRIHSVAVETYTLVVQPRPFDVWIPRYVTSACTSGCSRLSYISLPYANFDSSGLSESEHTQQDILLLLINWIWIWIKSYTENTVLIKGFKCSSW